MPLSSKSLFLFTGFLLISHASFSQTDSARIQDSVNNSIIQQYHQKLAEIESQRKEDSIKKAALQAQINALKATDTHQKELLEKQLQSLREQEATRLAVKKAKIDSLRKTAKAYPVTGFFSDTLFLIYDRLGSLPAPERAATISARIKQLSGHYSFQPDSLKIVNEEPTIDIVFRNSIIMSVSENDALWNNVTKTALAQKYKQIIANEVVKYKQATRFSTLAKEIGLALLVLILLIIVLHYVTKLFQWISRKIPQQEGKWIKGFQIRNYTLFDTKHQVNVLLSVSKLLKWIIILFLLYITLPIIFGIFPWSRNFAETLLGYILNPLKKMGIAVWDYLPNLFTIVVIIVVFYYLLKGIHFLKSEIEKGKLIISGFYPDWANPTYQILRVLLLAFMFVLIFPYLPGSNTPVFKGVSVFLGFLFTFGSMSSLSNLISGIVLTYMRLFKIGDYVRIGEVTGDIIEKSLLVTRVRTIKNEIISIPNSTVMSSHTVNYSSESTGKGLILHTTVSIGYDVPWKSIHEALLKAAGRTALLLKDPKPFVLQTSLDDFYASYQINAYTTEANKQSVIYSELHQNIQDCCNEMGIEILSPHYRAARDGNMTAIPADYLDKNYKAPGFNVNIQKEGTE